MFDVATAGVDAMGSFIRNLSAFLLRGRIPRVS